MSEATRQENLELEVADFGPIIEAKIDLRPLTVFVGPSNTGKTYLATLIYALHRFFHNMAVSNRYRSFQTQVSPRNTETPALDFERRSVLTEWAAQAFVHRLPGVGNFPLPEQVAEVVRRALGIDGVGLRNEIVRCFGVNHPGMLKRKAKGEGAHIAIGRFPLRNAPAFRHKQTLRTNQYSEFTTHPGNEPISINIGKDARTRMRRIAYTLSSNDQTEDSRNLAANELLLLLVNLVLPGLIDPLHNQAFYLPAGRTGLIETYGNLVIGLLREASDPNLRAETRNPAVSGVMADFLTHLTECDSMPRGIGDSIQNRATKIEEDILSGSVSVEKSELLGRPEFLYQPKGWKNPVPLMNASSMVSELTPVVLYLRHLVKRHDLLIIDEPESHLHPQMQVEFTRQLGAMVNSGVRVVVTTHSEWVLEALANMVQGSTLSEVQKNGNISLRPDQVGIWLFRHKARPKGSIAQEIRLDEETGLFPNDYDAVSEELYNENVKIFNRVQDRKAE